MAATPVASRTIRGRRSVSGRRRLAGQRNASATPASRHDGPGVGAVVDARGVGEGLEQDPREDRRAGDAGQHPGQQPPAAEERDAGRHHRRPEEVELLLHGQRPEVQEHRRPAELVEVRLVGEHEVPVGDVAERRQRGPAQLGDLARVDDHHHRQDDGHHREEGRQQPPRAADPEPHQVDGPGGAPLGEQQRGDQVAADHEEHVDAEEAARQPGGADVVGDDRGDGEGPQAVDPGHVREAGSPRRPGRAHAGAARSRRGMDPASVISRPSAAPWVRSRQTLSRVRRGRDGSCPARPGVGGSRQSGRVCGARSG